LPIEKLFHKRVRVFNFTRVSKHLRTMVHSTVHQAIFIVLLNLQNTQDNKNYSALPASCFHCRSCFTNSREQSNCLVNSLVNSIVLACLHGNPGKTLTWKALKLRYILDLFFIFQSSYWRTREIWRERKSVRVRQGASQDQL
jgi:hypothetical protein